MSAGSQYYRALCAAMIALAAALLIAVGWVAVDNEQASAASCSAQCNQEYDRCRVRTRGDPNNRCRDAHIACLKRCTRR